MDIRLTWKRAAGAAITFVFALAASTALADTPTTPSNIDPDSFGRNLIFLGLATTSTVSFSGSCADADPELSTPPNRCVEVTADSAPIAFSFPDLGSIYIPANSTKTIIWPMFIQNAWWHLHNATSDGARGRFRTNVIFTFESDVLKDPSATCPDPETGYAVYCNGRYVTSFPLAYGEDTTLAAGARTFKRVRAASAGIGAFATTVLANIIPEKLVKKMFAEPMIIRFGLSGRVSLVDPEALSFFFVGVRLIGDQ